jgi:hypothetical protein
MKLPLASPSDSAAPESSSSVREPITRYRPNLREDDPLLRARTTNWSRALRHGQCSRAPAPITNLRQVVAMLADVELVTLHRRPVSRARLLYLIGKGDALGPQRPSDDPTDDCAYDDALDPTQSSHPSDEKQPNNRICRFRAARSNFRCASVLSPLANRPERIRVLGL